MLLPLIAVLFLLMLPVTGMVPVLTELTIGRYPELGDVARHSFMSINMIGALLAAPLAGLASDRLGRRTALITGAFLVNGVSLLLMTQLWSYQTILLLRFIEGCAHMTALSLLMTLATDHAKRSRMGFSMGAVGAAISLGVAAGAPLGGWIGAETATRVPWLGGWLCIALAIVAPLILRDHSVDAGANEKTAEQNKTINILTVLRENRLLALPYLFTFVDRLTVGFIISTFSLYLGTVQQYSPSRIGAIMAAFLIPFSILTFPAGVLCRYWDRLAMMICGSILYGIFLFLLIIMPEHTLFWLMIAGGTVAAIMYAPTLVLTAELAQPGRRAITMAGFNVAGSLGFAIGPLLSGALVAAFRHSGISPYTPVFGIIATIEIVVALTVIPLWLRGDIKLRHPTHPI